ncbi:autotransporter assembly complex protein TamA [Roseateles sp.]|jgi:translocation and assembly module TamA|uniref:autotransporter assembly complex protein TamA n=1 Tax=Roseateles sp. TaxID=1971397 RepID=UPI00391A5A3D
MRGTRPSAPWLAWIAAPLLSLLLTGCANLNGLLERANGQRNTPSTTSEGPQRQAYKLQVQAPSPLAELLSEHLDLARFQRVGENEGLSRGELERLASGTPAQVRSLLETEGYFNASAEVLWGEQEQGLPQLTVRVTPGPQARISALDLSFDGALQNPQEADAQALAQGLRRQLLQDFGLQPGRAFRQADWSSAKTESLARVRSSGYPLARWAHTSARVQADNNQVELELLLHSGPLFRLGELQIEGLKHYSENTVRRLSRLRSGQVFTERALLDLQEDILKTQLFDGATVEIQPETSQAEATPVLIKLREAPLQQATTGVGYSANKGQGVKLEYLHRQPFGLSMRSLSKLDYSRELRSASIELTSHPQPDLYSSLGSLTLEEDRSTELISTNLLARLGRLRETARDERLDYLELLRSRERLRSLSYSISAVSVNTQRIWRRVDSQLLPTDGHTATLLLGLGQARSTLADRGGFASAHLKLGWYKPLAGRRWFASARLELAQLQARSEVDIPDRLLYRAGGDDSVRGYAYRSLGPQLGSYTLGGSRLFTGSVELARPLSASLPAFWGAAFIDAGRAANSWRQIDPAVGWGVGLRWRSPVGPLRLDLARGEELKKWRLHFSVGIVL